MAVTVTKVESRHFTKPFIEGQLKHVKQWPLQWPENIRTKQRKEVKNRK